MSSKPRTLTDALINFNQALEHAVQGAIEDRRDYQGEPIFRDRHGLVIDLGDLVVGTNHRHGIVCYLYIDQRRGDEQVPSVIIKQNPNSYLGEDYACGNVRLIQRAPANSLDVVITPANLQYPNNERGYIATEQDRHITPLEQPDMEQALGRPLTREETDPKEYE